MSSTAEALVPNWLLLLLMELLLLVVEGGAQPPSRLQLMLASALSFS
eukprot:CAMPEP_0178718240 /NCGR_PEP_ID=MMETSP0699-20121125/22412_1 /TAXON_ID=265572 /ORGANISM="Extubocellulus spinifer, Strain CCMP396" /LENGTH=46 /DNA_ID= /DNA_START= /DNA_END= /DNA_ORIENTATION=